MKIFTLLYISFIYPSSQHDSQYDKKEWLRYLEKLDPKETRILEGHNVITRFTVTPLDRFRSYRNVAVLFYAVPTEVRQASFAFQADNMQSNLIGSCKEEDVEIYLKYGSYPAVNPDGYPFPQGFITSRDEELYHIPITTNKTIKRFVLDNPLPGDWYAIAFLKWQDPRNEKVAQQGLSAKCQANLYADLQVTQEKIDVTDCYSQISVNLTNSTKATRKCMITDSTNTVELDIFIDTALKTNVSVKIQANCLPSGNSFIVFCYLYSPMQHTQLIKFQPQPNQWHYIEFEIINSTEIAECESYSYTIDDDIVDQTTLNLMRDDKGSFFSFDYTQASADLQESMSLVNLTCGNISSLKFTVNPFLDLGGTLKLSALLFLKQTKNYMSYTKELDVNSTFMKFSANDQFFKIVICSSINYASIPLENGSCKYNDVTKPAIFTLNNTDSYSINKTVFIPFPEGGDWYVSMRLFCDNTVCPCISLGNGTEYFVETNKSNMINYREEAILSENVYNGSSGCNATVMFAVSSLPCVSGKCSNHGSCLLTAASGHVISSCSCFTGYGGWDCSDSSRMDSLAEMLTAILLLTLSNLPFFFSIYVAIIRLYFTEAVMYSFTMFMSTFYHACDASTSIAYCITDLKILQFGDFYCGIMSFWVTLLAMSIIPNSLLKVLQLSGAILVAMLTTWNMQSLYAFMLPVCIGIAILSTSWIVNAHKTRAPYFPKSYYRKYLPAGLILVSIGLICYAFLQTEQNYKFVHSVWHMIIALSVVLLLPDCKRGDVHPFLPCSQHFKFWNPCSTYVQIR